MSTPDLLDLARLVWLLAWALATAHVYVGLARLNQPLPGRTERP